MSKLPKQHQFIDLSDYGRPVAVLIAKQLVKTKITPIHVTIGFIIAGLIAVFCIVNNQFYLALAFLILKSVLDAADGTLARLRNTPSYVGRYFDSVSDIILNFIILLTIGLKLDTSFLIIVMAFIGIQLQGTLYNYYYVIMRNRLSGDSTSRVFENKTPVALPGEKQKHVNLFFGLYKVLYGLFDKAIYYLDRKAVHQTAFPRWFMTLLSTFGLGFQLLLIGLFLALNLIHLILPFFIVYTLAIFVFVGIRMHLNKKYKMGAEVNA